jgi:very-long-chain (3R)-3-hydroxyacyl-CoA dehydratase
MNSSCSITKGSCCKKLVNGYLVIYNSLSAMAWAFLLFSLAKSFFADDLHNHQVLFAKTGLFLARLQTVALLEVLHAALGWVRSGVLSNVIQISSRLFVIWMAAVYSNTGHLWAYGMMATAWALSDFTRYAYYLTQLTGLSSPVLKWARYNFFLVLYPVGTLGEAILIFFAMKKWENLNPPLSYLLLAVLAIYTPGTPSALLLSLFIILLFRILVHVFAYAPTTCQAFLSFRFFVS